MKEEYLIKARKIADDYRKNVLNKIGEILLFPDPAEEEIRLLQIVPSHDFSPEGISPWYFAPSTESYPYKLAVAIIRPEEKQRLKLPDRWGAWEDAVQLYPWKARKVRRKA